VFNDFSLSILSLYLFVIPDKPLTGACMLFGIFERRSSAIQVNRQRPTGEGLGISFTKKASLGL